MHVPFPENIPWITITYILEVPASTNFSIEWKSVSPVSTISSMMMVERFLTLPTKLEIKSFSTAFKSHG